MTISSPDSLPGDEPQEGASTGQGQGDGGVPGRGDGVGIGAEAEPNTFEPEEDPDEPYGPESD
ncbi:hypothetical protein FHJ30_17970 [Arthrobacter sp. BB-1]|uniref:hypothetical protein n=1 Tax=unclassified Arthrobacter TaxID=235627 RepID=UPI001111BD2E|nr:MULTISPECIES: hypothetical protein [unclassified Arthrobacter]TNB69480.1 hypothetical protein FHJ30_17970 [Arthrobacter sp. BB-1]